MPCLFASPGLNRTHWRPRSNGRYHHDMHRDEGRAWPPTSYDPNSHILYVPIVEACMDFTYINIDGRGWRRTLRPPPQSDGKHGRLQAFDVEKRKVVWIARQRA